MADPNGNTNQVLSMLGAVILALAGAFSIINAYVTPLQLNMEHMQQQVLVMTDNRDEIVQTITIVKDYRQWLERVDDRLAQLAVIINDIKSRRDADLARMTALDKRLDWIISELNEIFNEINKHDRMLAQYRVLLEMSKEK